MAAAALISSGALASDGDAPSWRSAAEPALLRALTDAYPNVVEWASAPLLSKRQHAKLAGAERFEATVVRVGKRSAVRLARHDDTGATSTTVWFAVSGTRPILTAQADIPARAVLTPELSGYVPQDALALACTPVQSPAALSGMRAKRSIHAGAAICTESIERRPAVGRGEDVTVVSTAGAVTIVGRAVAQQDGRIGEVLRVKNPSSGEVYFAAVSGEREVVVHE